LTPFAAFIPLQAGPTEPLSCRFPCSIVHLLSPGIRDILKETDGREPDLSSVILGLVLSGVTIWEGRSRAVVQIGEDVVVKIAQHLAQTSTASCNSWKSTFRAFLPLALWG